MVNPFEILGFNNIIWIILFIIPGYIILYVVSIITEYIYERNQLDKIIQYLLFSFVAYMSSIVMIFSISSISYLFISLFKPELSNKFLIILDTIYRNYTLLLLIISFVAIAIAPKIGFLLGTKYFGQGYPHKIFKEHTDKKFTPSIYALLKNKYKLGAWLSCHMKDKTIIHGTFSEYDFDEEKRDYVITLIEAKRFFPKSKRTVSLIGDEIVINLKNVTLLEFKK